MNVSLSQAPWPWNLGQPLRPVNAAPGAALSGPLAEDPAPPAEGASEAEAWGAPIRPADLPAPQRVTRSAQPQSLYYRRSGALPSQGQAAGQNAASRPGLDLYV